MADGGPSRQITAQSQDVVPNGAVDVTGSAAQVRQHLAAQADKLIEPPMRTTDAKTGQLKILSSAKRLMAWLPKMGWDHLSLWCTMPIFRVRLFADREAYVTHDRSYVEQVFPEGEDLETAVLWWRKRVNQENKGFAVFEGGYDSSGPLLLTDAPRVCVNAVTGECEADGADEVERKRLLHNKRRQMAEKWGSKGVSEDMLRKIENAEFLIKDKKRRGQEFMLKGGWVKSQQVKSLYRDVEIKDVETKQVQKLPWLTRHNNLAKLHG